MGSCSAAGGTTAVVTGDGWMSKLVKGSANLVSCALDSRFSFLIFAGHLILSICLRHFFMNTCTGTCTGGAW
jgi:hypothetical protein